MIALNFTSGDFCGLDPADDEFASVDTFAEYLADDDQATFDWRHLNCISERTGRSNSAIKRELEAYGFKLANRAKPNMARGFRTSSNDRYYGPGAEKMHGGSGWEEITGMCGREG
jgi:hypothetical protein